MKTLINMHSHTSMKILLILETSGGGSGRHVIDLTRELIKFGHNVTVAYSGLRASTDFYHEINSIAGANLLRVDMRRSPCPGDVIALAKLRKILSTHGPFDVIHGHSSKGGALARIAAIGKPGIRVYTPHAFRTLDSTLGVTANTIYSIIERLLSTITTAIILVSEAEKKHALDIGLPANKLYVIENGMVIQQLSSKKTARENSDIPQGKICIGFVGRFVPQKAADRLIRSFAMIAHKHPDAELVMLGDGPLQVELHQLANQLDINHQVRWLTDINGAEIMPALDMFVMPSLYEAFPYVLLEAANAGLPIIATPVGGTDEMLIDQVNGFIVGHNEPETLANAIEKLIINTQLRLKMGEESKNIGQKYSATSMTEKTLSLYSSKISGE